jgi:hypothetical protein
MLRPKRVTWMPSEGLREVLRWDESRKLADPGAKPYRQRLVWRHVGTGTQDEDRCPMRQTTAARNLSLFRSLAIFLFQRQAQSHGAKKSLPDFERHVHRKPWGLIHRFTQRQLED